MNEFERFRLCRVSSCLGFDQNVSMLAILSSKNVSIFFPTRNTTLSTRTKYKREKERTSSLRETERTTRHRRRKIYPRPKRAVNARTGLKAARKKNQCVRV